MLIILLVSSLSGAMIDNDGAFGTFCVVAAVPLLAVAIGGVTTHLYHQLSADKALELRVRSATYTTLNLNSGVRYADRKIEEATAAFAADDAGSGLIHMHQAKTATELTLLTGQQASREWELLSTDGYTVARTNFTSDEQSVTDRPTIKQGDKPQPITPDPARAPSEDDGQKRGTDGELSY
ncbi:hypothetical protein [Williamsia muralis]|uniref:hypothetical protein n=1 Tax=Williamsia marianensis TaxID=85044 RepID=UPI00117BEA42|nr:hypothetical protein [Williamsia marianensis]